MGPASFAGAAAAGFGGAAAAGAAGFAGGVAPAAPAALGGCAAAGGAGAAGFGGVAPGPEGPSGGFAFGSFSEGSLAIVRFGSVSFAGNGCSRHDINSPSFYHSAKNSVKGFMPFDPPQNSAAAHTFAVLAG